MKRCPITYKPIEHKYYSKDGLRLLSPKLRTLYSLGFSKEELLEEAKTRATKISIQGVQPKLSAILNIKKSRFDLVDSYGRYIIKPQHPVFEQLPENEDLTMRLAEMVGIRVPIHGMIYAKDGSLNYFIKRFDRRGQRDKVAVEDFAQLAGLSRETKYNYSMEKLLALIDQFCTFPMVEKAKIFQLVLFNFIVGNEDMHLKNYSVIIQDGKVELSPSYDLINSTIVLKGEPEEIALTIQGKKKKLNHEILVAYFGKERCGLTDPIIQRMLDKLNTVKPSWFEMIDRSFLSETMKQRYSDLISQRIDVLGL